MGDGRRQGLVPIAAALVVVPAPRCWAPLFPAPAPHEPSGFDCFGSRCGVWVPATTLTRGRRRPALPRGWHARFTRFLPASELSRLNARPARVVPSPR